MIISGVNSRTIILSGFPDQDQSINIKRSNKKEKDAFYFFLLGKTSLSERIFVHSLSMSWSRPDCLQKGKTASPRGLVLAKLHSSRSPHLPLVSYMPQDEGSNRTTTPQVRYIYSRLYYLIYSKDMLGRMHNIDDISQNKSYWNLSK